MEGSDGRSRGEMGITWITQQEMVVGNGSQDGNGQHGNIHPHPTSTPASSRLLLAHPCHGQDRRRQCEVVAKMESKAHTTTAALHLALPEEGWHENLAL